MVMPNNVFRRVLHIDHGGNIGSGFLIDVDKKQYLVTARHLVETMRGGGRIGIYFQREWVDANVRLVGHASADVDISVLSLERLLVSPSCTLNPSMGGLMYGQDVFFLGFPHGFVGDVGDENDGFPLPFVKRALVSCISNGEERHVIYLDGHNNVGFSGGPVVFKHGNGNDFHVAAVISGYQTSVEPILDGDLRTRMVYEANTGIIIAHSIQSALSIISENPVGFPIP